MLFKGYHYAPRTNGSPRMGEYVGTINTCGKTEYEAARKAIRQLNCDMVLSENTDEYNVPIDYHWL